MKPDDTFIDQPVEIPLKGGEIWRPNDDVPPTGKPMTLRDAVALSRNRITAQVMEKVGPASVARLARDMGVRESPLERVPSLAFGTAGHAEGDGRVVRDDRERRPTSSRRW